MNGVELCLDLLERARDVGITLPLGEQQINHTSEARNDRGKLTDDTHHLGLEREQSSLRLLHSGTLVHVQITVKPSASTGIQAAS